MSKFNQFTTLDKELVDALASIGFVELSPIQEKTIPLLLKHKDGVFKAPTGSGKTLAYLVPIIQSIKGLNDTKAVVIVPTKVLANQAGEVLKNIRQVYPNFTYSVIKDGNDLVKSNKTSSIIIATPNLFLKSMHEMNLREVEYLIFDEGDMLIFGGFEEQLNQIMSLPLKATKALFTASVDEHLNTLVRHYMGTATSIDLTEGSVTASEVTHTFVDIRHLSKAEALCLFLDVVKPYKAIAFVSNKKDLADVEEYLLSKKIKHSYIHGDLPKREQKKALKDFKDDRTTLLLASDIAARGLDVSEVSDVISLDLPKDLAYYYHRAGRTGRFGNSGHSYIFYTANEPGKARELMKKSKITFKYATLRTDELKADRDLNVAPKKQKINNVYLEKEIKRAIAKNRSKKVKPCCKKKVKWAIDDVKRRHKEQIIKTNVRKKQKENENK